MPRPRILDEAAEELGAAAAYLEAERPGWGRKFLRAYEEKLEQISEFPESGSNLESPRAGAELQSFRLRKFLHAIVVAEIDDEHWVIAIAHPNRKPG